MAHPLRLHASLIAGFILCCSPAHGEGPGTPESEAGRLPESVEDFFARAAIHDPLPAAGRPEPETAAEAAAMPAAFICPDEQSLDFAGVQHLRQYSQLIAFLTGMRGRDTEDSARAPARGQDRLKAYLALGMYSELIAQSGPPSDPGSDALVSIARFLDKGSPEAAGELDRLAECAVRGRFWASLAGLARADADSVKRFSESLTEFRSLPFFLRVDVAAFSAPLLLEQGQTVLAETLMASFGEDEFATSAKLRFLEAILAMHSNSPGAVASAREQMRHPQFRDMAISLLAQNEAPVPLAAVDVLKLDIASQFAAIRSEAERLALTDFWIGEAHGRGDLSILESLIKVPALSDPVSREKLRRGISSYLSAQISDGDTDDALSALGVLVSKSQLSDIAHSDIPLMTTAISFATDHQMPALAQFLADRSGHATGSASLAASRITQAEWALEQDDYDTVFAIAGAGPASGELTDLAVKAALRSGDRSALVQVLANASPDPAQALAWLEEETLQGAFLLPDTIIERANRVAEPDLRRRLEIVRTLRAGAASNNAMGQREASLTELMSLLKSPPTPSEQRS